MDIRAAAADGGTSIARQTRGRPAIEIRSLTGVPQLRGLTGQTEGLFRAWKGASNGSDEARLIDTRDK